MPIDDDHDDDHDDPSPRPQKRLRHESTPTSTSSASTIAYSRIPAPHLLLALPSLVLHPPTHRHHLQSVHVAQQALRRCLQLNIDRDLECQAWTALAELGLLCLAGPLPLRLQDRAEDARRRGELEGEVEKALTKALPIAQKHPSLRAYYPHLTILSARLSHIQGNPRFAHHTLKRLLSTFASPATAATATTTPNPNPHVRDPPHVVYAAHLALVHSLASDALSALSSASVPPRGSGSPSPVLQRTLGAIQDLYALAASRRASHTSGHAQMALLAQYLRLHTLVRHGEWAHVESALQEAEAEVEAEACGATGSARVGAETSSSSSTVGVGVGVGAGGVALQLEMGILVLGVVYHTYAGAAGAAGERLARLHGVLDAVGVGADDTGNGVSEVQFPTDADPRPLHVAHTHPRVLYALAFLLSAAAKRDAVGRRPKKGVFAREGLGVLERGGWGGGTVPGVAGEVPLPVYASLGDVWAVTWRMGRIRADLMAEVVGLAIMRSEFEEAESTLNALIAYTRTHALFPAYAARITLQHAQLAHARAQPRRALECYRVAEGLAVGADGERDGDANGERGEERDGERDEWVRVAARAGQVWVRIGLLRLRARARRGGGPLNALGLNAEADVDVASEGMDADTDAAELEALRRLGGVVAGECAGLGGALRAVGEVLRACLGEEYLGVKTHLKRALDGATAAQDNHLRAVVLALVAAQYLHTARGHAETMLGACEQLAAGLGAGVKGEGKEGERGKGEGGSGVTGKKGRRGDAVGNAQLRLWVGERFLELRRWGGDAEGAERQVRVNERLRRAVGAMEAVEGRGDGV